MSEREVPTIRTRCVECGEPFEAPMYAMVRVAHYCARCRAEKLLAFETDQAHRKEATLANRRREWMGDVVRGIPEQFRGYEWEDFRFDLGGDGNSRKVKALREYADQFPVTSRPVGYQSLVIASEMNGVGKTLLSSLILKTLLSRYAEVGREIAPYQFWTAGAIRRRLRAAERYGSAETVDDVYNELGRMHLLILDDVGKEQLAGYEAGFNYDMYFNIIDMRYSNKLPILLTTNLSYTPWVDGGISLVDLMGRASVSRLQEMSRGVEYVIEGRDRRGIDLH